MPGIYTDVNLDELGTRTSHGDGSTGPADESRPGVSQGPVGPGPLLEEQDETKVFTAIHKIVTAQEKLAKNRDEKAKHWARVRRGVPFSTLEKDEDRATWRATLPPGVNDTQQPIPNKADDLCSKIVSQVLTDPFLPNPKPEDENDEKHRAAADLAKRFLTNDGDESGTNDQELMRDCLDTAMVRTAFVHVWVDETAGGWRPKQIMAAPDAMDPSQPMLGATGQPVTDYVLRYVTAANQFTDDPSQADRQWLPKHQRDVLTDANVRTVPETAPPERAEAVILLMAEPLRAAKRRFPELKDFGNDVLQAMLAWRPKRPKAIVPSAFTSKVQAPEKDDEVSEDALLFYYLKYCRVGEDYPDGAAIAVNGANGGVVISRSTLRDDVPMEWEGAPSQTGLAAQAAPVEDQAPPNTAAASPLEGVAPVVEPPSQPHTPILRDIPVSMLKARHDSESRDPFGRGTIDQFGGANEALANLYGAVLEDNDRRLHPNVFAISTSPVQDYQLTERSGKIIPVLSDADMVKYEEFAPLPTFLPDILQRLEEGMDRAANLGETGQALENPNATSGIAKQIVVSQVKVALAQTYQNTLAFLKRYWRLKLQLAQAKLTVPQQVEYTGTDSAYKQRWWTGADFHGVKDVSLQAGTGTMQSGPEKQQMLAFAQGSGWLDPEEAMTAGRSSVAGDLGLNPDPHTERANRELAAWSEGPPDNWTPAAPAVDPNTGAAMVDPMTGQPAMSPPSFNPFEPRLCDQDQSVAVKRYRIFRDFMATSDYSRQPPEWRALLDQASEMARQASGTATVAEQQIAAQEQADRDAAQQGAERDANASEKESDRAFTADQNAQDRAAQAQRPRAA